MTLSVQVQDLELCYGEVKAIDGLSFRLQGGGIYGLLGRNGSGKSTLLAAIAGFRKANAGNVSVGGEPVFENGRMTHQICLIREGGDTVDGSESIECALEFAESLRPHWDGAYASHLLERFQLTPKKKIGSLSRGQRSALAVTLGLASRAPLTMFDESYLGMDAPSRYVFYDEIVRDYGQNPRTIVISTHLIEEVSSLFEEIVIIDKGSLLLQDEAEALRTRGATITGKADLIDGFSRGMKVLSQKSLGSTKSIVTYGALDESHYRKAAELGLDIGPLPVQDLFVHLTTSSGESNDNN